MEPLYTITRHEFMAILILRMTADPFPHGFDAEALDPKLNEIAANFGFDDWIAAYHAL